MKWTVLIPAKGLPAAKSRLSEITSDPAAHARLVVALRADTIVAAQAAPEVARVLLIVDDPATAASAPVNVGALEQIRPGLNEAVFEGSEYANRMWPDDGVVALVGDLPALRPEELSAVLEAAAQNDRGYVADAAGTGTTTLTARPGFGIEPRFGPGSAALHAQSHVALPAGPGLRCDVDTPDDLRDALEIGVGAATLTAATALSAEASAAVHLGRR